MNRATRQYLEAAGLAAAALVFAVAIGLIFGAVVWIARAHASVSQDMKVTPDVQVAITATVTDANGQQLTKRVYGPTGNPKYFPSIDACMFFAEHDKDFLNAKNQMREAFTRALKEVPGIVGRVDCEVMGTDI